MPAIDPKDYLWKNICSLMGDTAPTVDAVQGKTGVGRGTIQRIKEGETSIGTDKLCQIAEAFNLEAWQLLVPGLQVPELSLSPELHRIAFWFDQLPTTDPAIRASAENRVMTVVIAALECAKRGQSLGLVQIVSEAPRDEPTSSPTQVAKRGKQSA